MAAEAAHGDVHRRGAGQRETRGPAYLARLQLGVVVKGEGDVGAGKPLVQTVRQQGGGPVDGLLGGLPDQDERAAPLILHAGHHPRGSKERRHVKVVPARVHDGDLLARIVLHSHLARVRQGRFLLHGQRVHVGSHQDGRALGVLHHRDHTVPGPVGAMKLPDALGDGISARAQLAGEQGGGLLLLMRKLGGGVELLIGCDKSGQLPVQRRIDVAVGAATGSDQEATEKTTEQNRVTHHGRGSVGRTRCAVTSPTG